MISPATSENAFYVLDCKLPAAAKIGSDGMVILDRFNEAMRAAAGRKDLPMVSVDIERGTSYLRVKPPHTHTVMVTEPLLLVRSLARLSNLKLASADLGN